MVFAMSNVCCFQSYRGFNNLHQLFSHRQGRYQHFIKTIFDNTSDTIPLFKRIQLHYESFLKKETFKQLGTYTHWITKLEMIFLKRKFQLWKHLIHSLQQYAKDRKKKMFHVLQR
jgi:hypothetical protein